MTTGKEIGGKLSVRDFVEQEQIMAACLSNKSEDHFICRITGIASGLRAYQNKYKRDENDSDKLFGLTGEFRSTGWNGETKDGNVLYLPANAHAAVEAKLTMDDVEGVRIGFDVYARYNEQSATKYTYVVRDVLEAENPTLAEIEKQLESVPLPTSSMKALSAPKK